MKSITKTAVAFAAIVGFSAVAQAEESETTPKNPWSECGIGAMIFPKLPVGAVISNIIWDLGTTAVSSAGSSVETCEGEGYAAAVYINETFVTLEEETAIGEGQYLTGLLDVAGCAANQQGQVVDALRTEYSDTLASPEYTAKTQSEKAQAYYNSLLSATRQTGACSII